MYSAVNGVAAQPSLTHTQNWQTQSFIDQRNNVGLLVCRQVKMCSQFKTCVACVDNQCVYNLYADRNVGCRVVEEITDKFMLLQARVSEDCDSRLFGSTLSTTQLPSLVRKMTVKTAIQLESTSSHINDDSESSLADVFLMVLCKT